VCAALALTVCLARVHVGAHLPLDVVGGAGLGLAIAGGVRLLLGRPA
jgi:membrane-associated phospholipid phosphatase